MMEGVHGFISPGNLCFHTTVTEPSEEEREKTKRWVCKAMQDKYMVHFELKIPYKVHEIKNVQEILLKEGLCHNFEIKEEKS
jgi:hypothetical protein